MSKLKQFIASLKPDRLIPSTSVFPEIDAEKLAADLNVVQLGRERGTAELPASDDDTLDPVEAKVVAEVNRLRVMGLNRFEEHMETYARRLREASNSKAELRTLAETTVTDYQTSVAIHHNALANHRQRVMERHVERQWFIADNRLRRTAYDRNSLTFSLGLAGFLVLVEAAMNGYFFSASNTLGLLGGMSVAVIISIVNVGFSLSAGYLARNVNHVRWPRKLAGWLVVLLIIAAALVFNVAVAHFRDAAGTLPWDAAVLRAIETFRADPTALRSFESWLLLCVGLLVCLLAFWKGYAISDPYPDYGRVQHRWELAREDYAESAEGALRDLEDLRNAAADDLEEARRTLTSNISEAIDILYARAGLAKQLDAFLDHAQLVVDQLLAEYRSANRAARQSTTAPAHFNRPHVFKATAQANAIPLPERDAAEAEIAAINDIVENTIGKIFDEYKAAVRRYESIDVLERNATTLPASLPARHPEAGQAT
ncbi:MAG: hypothetical protein LJE69_07770 [Thiohalocapsa sp.]|jgi:hypothetical protein|uniref:hypothetical protein n=1 Tax=Thiohalocapsa sp. TaxID=2497641 RepID=UPI0025CFDD38|nr:hypothetical protein [Thiohalocapsa sp.]MCG6941132.1 hypothetical protein [Thiohalocapsa sp.]